MALMKRWFRVLSQCGGRRPHLLIISVLGVNVLFLMIMETKYSIRGSTVLCDTPFSVENSGGLTNGLVEDNSGANSSLLLEGLRERISQARITLEEFYAGKATGNPLIDGYGRNNLSAPGEMGLAVRPREDEKDEVDKVMAEFHINTLVSDRIPLNRMVPDSRLKGCDLLKYAPENLPTASVIVPFYNEWPSLLVRTIYSIINRTPRRNLKEIILVDDASTLEALHRPLVDYIDQNFPQGLVKLIRIADRKGLTKARMRGCDAATGDVVVFFDSHMEVNIDWLQPMLTEIAKDRKTVAMATLDYVQADTFEYRYNHDYLTRYGWTWTLGFFESLFRDDQIGKDERSPRVGASMVGAAFAVERNYFMELGGYDDGMIIWGGENLEMTWRVWLCGGRLIHVPCSRIGHVARSQPYSFLVGRQYIEHFNYKRAAAVWMGDYIRFPYAIFPDMKNLDVGDLSERLALKTKLGCKDFSWYLQNIWPELNVYDENSTIWGQVRNQHSDLCLDTDNHLYQYDAPLAIKACDKPIYIQGFTLKTNGLLMATLQCVVSHDPKERAKVNLGECSLQHDTWSYTQEKQLVHTKSSLCMEHRPDGVILNLCTKERASQKWIFQQYSLG
ncbi:inactive polypeptide N-acetylgalactosaminyltransferase-like protein 5 [Physella acuta]|uniref:inactive polypeptide N-acetylgalactosaminyltransferase-like protein 5 n=1 Tax=Physella acuta TaxID=109671 RepID=UPI0027DE11BA|nr:inactive polypeptide N-acetylgalactosaminyltransferase-like protein 5 [Physella acuta]XP_059169553.1 inactive polypeptide N-acetylgalactosaminyltransferase-like protein 5 [Physella acuta]XP_059169554.1 inactive polypeptide N-acetylgalactosaminyltransferase-like protein 5 [Physella acuta]